MQKFQVNDEVLRDDGDKSRDGNRGTVIEVSDITMRCRIQWHTDRSGNAIKIPRTWMRFGAIKKIPIVKSNS